MKTFLAHEYKDEVKEAGCDFEVGVISLKKESDLEIVYKLLNDEEDFILKYEDEEGEIESRVVIASSISSKVKNCEIKLIAVSDEEEEE